MRFENLRSKAILRIIVGSTKKLFYGEISFYYQTKICHKTNFLYIPAKASKQPLVSVPIILDHPVLLNGYQSSKILPFHAVVSFENVALVSVCSNEEFLFNGGQDEEQKPQWPLIYS